MHEKFLLLISLLLLPFLSRLFMKSFLVLRLRSFLNTLSLTGHNSIEQKHVFSKCSNYWEAIAASIGLLSLLSLVCMQSARSFDRTFLVSLVNETKLLLEISLLLFGAWFSGILMNNQCKMTFPHKFPDFLQEIGARQFNSKVSWCARYPKKKPVF